MADGDNADAIGKRFFLLHRDVSGKGQLSYFFDHHVQQCISEQHKLLGSQLSEKEKEAGVTYDKSFSSLFDGEAKINAEFVKVLFDSKAPTSLDSLIEDLSTFANGEGHTNKIRLFDLLFVTNNVARLLEEQKVHNADYDLYDAKAKGKLGAMKTYTNLLSNSLIKSGYRTPQLAMWLSMLATGQEPLVDAALLSMAKIHCLPWDALLLARFYYGPNHETTRRVHDAWTESVLMKEEENKFPMIKIARSLYSNNLKSVVRTLMAEVKSKTKGKELIHAYRCLAISLEVNSSQLSELERKLEVAEVLTMMRSIFVTMLGWGNIVWAKSIIADITNRAPLGDIPADIYQIGLICVVELVETLLIPLSANPSTTLKGPFTTIASKWRKDIAGNGEMRKLKTDNLAFQKVLYDWIKHLGAALRAPLLEEPDLTMKMDCVFLAAEYLHELLRWAATAPEDEPLHLYSPNKPIQMKIEDDAIVVREEVPRGRNSSVVSTRSTLTAKEDGKKQTNKGDVNEERPIMPLVHDVRNQQQNRERIPSLSESWPRGQKNEQQQTTRGMNQRGGGDAGYGQANQQNNVTQLSRGQPTQDYRKNQQATGGNGEYNGAHLHGAAILNRLLPHAAQPGVRLAQTHAPPHETDVPRSPRPETHRNDSVPTSASSSGGDLTTKSEERDCSSTTTTLPVISQESLAAMTEPAMPNPLKEIFNQQQQTQSTEMTPSILPSPKSPLPDPTPEQIQARLGESMRRNAAASQLPASGEQLPASPSIPQQPTMGTAVIDKARERRSLESVQPVQQTVESQQPADSQYTELMEKEQKENGDERPIAPEPGEMNRLFTGNSKGQSTLPPNLSTEQDAAAGAAAPTMIMQSVPPPPALVATAVESESSLSSLELTMLTPPPLELPAEENRGYESSSAESVLSPITEASQETFGTGNLESDGPGMVADSPDLVFDDCADHNTVLEVDVDAQSADSPIQSQQTPQLQDLLSSQSRYQSREDIVRLTLSPLAVASSQQNTTIVAENSVPTTVVETTSQSMGVRREAEDENQMHAPIPTPGSSDQQENIQAVVKTPEVQTVVPTEMDAAPANEQQQTVVPTATGYPSLFSDAPLAPAATPNEPVMTVSVMPHFEEPAMEQSSHSVSNEQQMGQSINEQIAPEEKSQFVQKMEDTTMVGTQPQRYMAHDVTEETATLADEEDHEAKAAVTSEVQSDSTTSQESKHLSVDCTESEVQERVTSCGVSYKFSPVKDDDSAVASIGGQDQSGGNSLLDGFLSMMDTTSSVSDGTITKDEIDEHAAHRRQEASERGDIPSEIGSTSIPHPVPPTISDVPSVPSSALTTPEPFTEYQKHYNLVPSNNGGGEGGEATTSTQMSVDSSMHSHGDQSEPQQHQFTSQPMVNSFNGEDISSQISTTSISSMQPSCGDGLNNPEPVADIPTYVNPFEQKPQLALYQNNVLNHPAPCFGTGGGQNTQQQQQNPGHGGQMIFTNSSLGQDPIPNWGGNQNRPYQHREGRGGRGGRGSRGGRGGGGGTGFTGGNSQPQHTFSGGDNGQQKNFSSRGSFGGQDVRAQPFSRGGGFSRGRGSS
ncbi:hypothetical protein PENTCL1PPCAC_1814 [Pristionchus entomophagus]|uniref:Protein transport protein sec16 n=1 Tax=Pristionchus entomophagus TaxID=358040 RepID=A0AAV5SAC7_9BILA|nr:hypothetical protein PENTCL1PPCAC_1814 [Pristionchus entomophagus]